MGDSLKPASHVVVPPAYLAVVHAVSAVLLVSFRSRSLLAALVAWPLTESVPHETARRFRDAARATASCLDAGNSVLERVGLRSRGNNNDNNKISPKAY